MRSGIVTVAVLAVAVIAMSGVLVFSDDADALLDVKDYGVHDIDLDIYEYAEIDIFDYTGTYNFVSTHAAPPGMKAEHNIISGTPNQLGDYSIKYELTDKSVSLYREACVTLNFHVKVIPEYYTVTYDAGVGLVHGSQVWSESILEESYASLPDASHSSGAYTFLGWSLSPTSLNILDTFAVGKDTKLYAVWDRNTVLISDLTATVTQGQTSVLKVSTNPANAAVSITNYGGLNESNVSVADHSISLDMTGVPSGNYHVILTASFTGYLNGTSDLTVMVPITITDPIQYSLSLGDSFAYTPVTDPSNATVVLKSLVFEGSDMPDTGCFAVEGRTITGTPEEPGTYELTYTASLPGYIEVSDTVVIFIAEPREPASDPVSLSSVMSSSRSGEPRVFDFVAVGGSNVSNYIWSVDGVPFSSSSPTALYEFPTAGIYTVECTAQGFDGTSVSVPVEVVCDDSYHMQAAWSGVEYGFVLDGTPEVSVSEGSPFFVTVRTVGDRQYTLVSGTPTDDDIGKTYEVNAEGNPSPVSWKITVYGKEAKAPVSGFTMDVHDRTVTASFTGQGASFWSFDFDGDGRPEKGNVFTYARDGIYTVCCTAVNNVSQVTVSEKVEVGVSAHEESALSQLTDFHMSVGEKIRISVLGTDTDRLLAEGPASDFVVIEGLDLIFQPSESGVFELTLTLQHETGTPEQRTIQVTVKDLNPDVEEIEHGYMSAIIVLFVIGIAAIAVFLYLEDRGYLRGGRE